jgi:hypothetical protein
MVKKPPRPFTAPEQRGSQPSLLLLLSPAFRSATSSALDDAIQHVRVQEGKRPSQIAHQLDEENTGMKARVEVHVDARDALLEIVVLREPHPVARALRAFHEEWRARRTWCTVVTGCRRCAEVVAGVAHDIPGGS